MQVGAFIVALGFGMGSATNLRHNAPVQLLRTDGSTHCPCIKNGVAADQGGNITAKDGTKFDSSYGESCKAWDDEMDPKCETNTPPAYCSQPWCYVDSSCLKKDVKTSFYFDNTLHYSYQACGGFDAYAAIGCLKEDTKTSCESASQCAWNEKAYDTGAACQNKFCQCKGENDFTAENKHEFGENYGKTCKAWEKQSGACQHWKDETELGLWCCRQWCYVDESCPSAKASSVQNGLYYSYFSCPDKQAELATCPWQKAVDYDGEPVGLNATTPTRLKVSALQGSGKGI